ncbi:DUF1223 domain-containing protein [Mucilaginibacter sp. SP1R1]|uniref:DUF1223 domain-containing protein n=1 Tax=Mucilaginibacter sp. SP1R1 TaxID=2723091 RepID=UPI0016215600|nr:DUF1223 domain-containing protein [Mucilaginibacter sp. SP1R1]MBB6149687.1 hypothetical protein [Mucilaginibacter sp. SP1R1]
MENLKITAISAGIAFLLITVAFISKSAASKITNPAASTGNGFAVLELFTSEGCSSCPAADDALARIQKEAGNKPVYVLAYHVDYWNRLGWKDKFSKPQYSSRQYQYSRQFAGQVYTPQVIINGKTECVGSDETALSNAITNGLNSTANASLNLQVCQVAGKADVEYQVTGNTSNSQLVIAVVQKHAVNNIKAGENEGRTLTHAQIVQQLDTIDLPASKQGTAHINLPAGFNTKDWEVIGLVQNSTTGAIVGAARAVLNAGTSAL